MYPEKFLNRMQNMLGNEYPAFWEALNAERAQGLRINLKKNVNKDELPFSLEKVEWCENGFYYDNNEHPGRNPLHFAGAYYIQEPSAMGIVPELEVEPDDYVLDLCAAPGGKSSQIAERLGPKGLLISNEINPKRSQILAENIERMGMPNVCITNEAPEKLSPRFAGFFDKILVDAPCSGEGMFRKDETAVTEWSEENVELCAARQDGILDEAAKMLLPGGRIVYSTCTFAPQEDEGSVERFLARHPEMKLIKQKRLWPHKVKGEGHFGAVFEKLGDKPARVNLPAQKQTLEKDYEEFIKANLIISPDELVFGGKYIKFGEYLYLVNSSLPDFKGLKIVRPGLCLGELKKNRFEPAHALGCALKPEEVKNSLILKNNEKRATDYLSGLSINCENENGWCLVCIDGYSCGWGKVSNGVLKNHYPKGLRIQGYKDLEQ